MDIKDLKVLVKMITETDITEFELESGEERIFLKRGSEPQVVQYQAAPAQMYAAPHAPAPVAAAPAAAVAEAAADEAGDRVHSPIVGTFYRAPAPDASPFVEVGQVVEKGQVLCIVEAMKLMNEIEAEYRCKIVKICRENAEPVEYNDTLFIVEKL
ncbi:MAG: acetyl-CoA carboxylase, biotin carboxyl carrier protein [Deltaproteobacteria bacterium]|nr:acetyl-CoA carboxylase, biotin carboxyl carrier protein [Deltaproteobacteria bacterium]